MEDDGSGDRGLKLRSSDFDLPSMDFYMVILGRIQDLTRELDQKLSDGQLEKLQMTRQWVGGGDCWVQPIEAQWKPSPMGNIAYVLGWQRFYYMETYKYRYKVLLSLSDLSPTLHKRKYRK
ncbi:uncharacterized protein LOC130769180 [Actinidia eriantha]|uniref:uncharacterized protein LOC130769180 n=1 Tax=Actinidia eriantha TaxID=165200 RepID=UPI002583A4CE|nr:uncharacterized protein LOC130769180 [Actinidia eriantha]